MGRRGLVLVLVGVLAAGCTTTVDGSRAAPAPATPVLIEQLSTNPCAALKPDQVRAAGLDGPGTREAHTPGLLDRCVWKGPRVTVTLTASPGQTLTAMRSGSFPYIDTTLAGRPALAYVLAGGCTTVVEAGNGTVLVMADVGDVDASPCPIAIRTVELAVETITGQPAAPTGAVDIDAIATDPCSTTARIPVAAIVGPGSVPVAKKLDTGDLSCRWIGDDGGMTFVAVAGASPAAPPGSQPTRVGDRAAFEVRRPKTCSIVVFADGRSLQITVVAAATAPRPDCESAHLAMQSLLGP